MSIRTLLTAAAMMFLVACGCVRVSHQPTPRSWPKPTPATNTMAFDGVFSNQSIDPKTGQPSDESTQLFDFLTGRDHMHGKDGKQVGIRSSLDESVLHVRLLDERELEIDSADLQRSSDFDLSKGFLHLRGPFSGTHGESSNLGTDISGESSQLYVSSAGDLLGRKSESEVGLLFYFVPVATSEKNCMMWPKIVSK
jgi:hypothetical protein